MIHCSNLECQTPNPIENQDCLQCGTPLIKRYLWAIGDWIKSYQLGETIEERYLLISSGIVLDLYPESPTTSPMDMPESMLPYLKLFPYRLHLPQIHSYLPSPDSEMNLEIWFLEYGSVPLDEAGNLRYGDRLFPAIADSWSKASARQQLQWLRQIAKLWDPLKAQGVVSSLLQPDLLCINDPFLQLLELRPDRLDPVHPDPDHPDEETHAPTLAQLGELWSSWAETAQPAIADFLHRLCQDLREGKIGQTFDLKILLEAGLQKLHQDCQTRYRLFSATDRGPLRDHNEDACYPTSGTVMEIEGGDESLLALVCDGIGGQDAGEIASQLAIESLSSELATLPFSKPAPPDIARNTLKFLQKAIIKTNDRIFNRNNEEERHERQRMGTTLVLSLFQRGTVYFAHSGDSRIYWITPSHCHQVTADDDWASKEVRLGYILYRDALQYPKSGALVQALGISNSSTLHPTVQNWTLDENCLILLCSDGLCDLDRVEQYWRSLLVPVLAGTIDVAEAGQKLIDLANEKNGHDNVSVALIHCQLHEPTDATLPTLDYDAIYKSLDLSLPQAFFNKPTTLSVTSANQPPPLPARPFWKSWGLGLGLVALGLMGGLAILGIRAVTSPSPTANVSDAAIAPGRFLEIQQDLPIYPQQPDRRELAPLTLPLGSVFQIQQIEANSPWVVVTVCRVMASGAIAPALSNQLGWIPRDRLDPANVRPVPFTACQEPAP